MSEARRETLKVRGVEAAQQATRDTLRLARAALADGVRWANAGCDRMDALHRAVMTALRSGLGRLGHAADGALDRVAAAVEALGRKVAQPPAGERSGKTRAA